MHLEATKDEHEFSFNLPGVHFSQAIHASERLRVCLNNTPILIDAQIVHVQASIGLDTYVGNENVSAKKFINRTLFYIILNFIRNTKESRNTYEPLEKVANQFLHLDLQYLGAVTEERAVKDAVRQQKPFIRRTPQSDAAVSIIAWLNRFRSLKRSHYHDSDLNDFKWQKSLILR